MKQKEKKHRRYTHTLVDAPPGETARYLTFNMMLAGLQPVDFTNPNSIYDRVMEYFNLCIKHDMRPTLTALALSLGMSRYKYAKIAAGEKGKEAAMILQGAKSIVEAQLQDYMHNGDVNPLQGMFELNNNYGYKNQIDVVSENLVDTAEDTKQIAARYSASLTDDILDDDE